MNSCSPCRIAPPRRSRRVDDAVGNHGGRRLTVVVTALRPRRAVRLALGHFGESTSGARPDRTHSRAVPGATTAPGRRLPRAHTHRSWHVAGILRSGSATGTNTRWPSDAMPWCTPPFELPEPIRLPRRRAVPVRVEREDFPRFLPASSSRPAALEQDHRAPKSKSGPFSAGQLAPRPDRLHSMRRWQEPGEPSASRGLQVECDDGVAGVGGGR